MTFYHTAGQIGFLFLGGLSSDLVAPYYIWNIINNGWKVRIRRENKPFWLDAPH